jgi:short-subunit dehydrogenase
MSIDYTGKTALVTGASSGLGAEFAEQLAAAGADLVLVARREDRLVKLANELGEKYKVKASYLVHDLSVANSGQTLQKELDSQGINVDILVNNAGFATNATVINEDRNKVRDEIQLNVGTLVDLTVGLIPAMVERNFGVIVNVSSTAGFQPVSNMAVYAATKSFVLSFTQALWGELQGKNVKVLAICPGATVSEFWDVAGMGAVSNKGFESPKTVVSNTLKELSKQKGNPYLVSGFKNRVLASSIKFMPTKMTIKMVGKMFEPQAK